MTTIQGELAPLELSADGGVTYKTLVCLETYDLKMTTTVNQVETSCGIATGLGAIKFTATGSAVMEANPDNTMVTLKDMTAWQLNKTLLKLKTEYPASGGQYGQNIALVGDVYVSDMSDTFQVGQVIKFAFTLTGTGTVSNLPQ